MSRLLLGKQDRLCHAADRGLLSPLENMASKDSRRRYNDYQSILDNVVDSRW